MEIKTLGIKVLKGTVQFAAKAVWFLLCKGGLAILLVMGFIAEAIASRKADGEIVNPLGNPYEANDLDDPENPSSPFFFPDNK